MTEDQLAVTVQVGIKLSPDDDITELLNEAKTTILCECLDGLTADELDGVARMVISFDHVFDPEQAQYVVTGTLEYERTA